tara:strand:- start:19369 stop:20472 length:1104 start_codon:yes stop_codon:yes gene_type:complete
MIKKIVKNLSNIPGWRTNRKIVVIESDDWGSIRMPSNDTRTKLLSQGLSMGNYERQRYTNYDTLASKEDFEVLFGTLKKFKDINGNHPKITAVSVVANPDFEKIKANNFNEYYYEPFTKTLDRYGLYDSFKMWQLGFKENFFVPQFHGREHLNIAVWLRDLQNGYKDTRVAFEHQCWGYANVNPLGIDYQAAFALELKEDIIIQKKVVKEGLNLFEKIHGYKADFFVPPNGPFNNQLENTAAVGGIKYISASKIQKEPQGQGKLKTKFHWLGQSNTDGQKYITRNCFFEPSDSSKDWIESCFADIKLSFKYKKPAVISSHRVNFTGRLDKKNREFGNHQLTILLKKITSKWPDIEFMTSSELGNCFK